MSSPIPSCLQLVQRLIKFDTRNPPGEVGRCVSYVEELLIEAGCEVTIRARDKDRPNLFARLKGRGDAPPLLLFGHADVVDPGGGWTHDPFAGEVIDDVLWGRGTLDMKGGIGMMVWSILMIASSDTPPPQDLLFALFSDEETGSSFGAEFMVKSHPELLEGVKYALGEVGGFNLTIEGQRFYLVQVDEKQGCEVRASVHGKGGHAALNARGEAMDRLGKLLIDLDRRRLPTHMTPAVEAMINHLADALDSDSSMMKDRLVNSQSFGTDEDPQTEYQTLFDAMVSNTATPTRVETLNASNIVPTTATLELNGRLLPGFSSKDLLAELQETVGSDVDFQAEGVEAPTYPTDLTLLPSLGKAVARHDPGAHCLPFLMPAGTDGRFLRQLGIQPYGFIPMTLPHGWNMFELMHAPNERVPVRALEFGARVLLEVLRAPIPQAN